MKIKCPVCSTINYFSGIEEGTRFCSNCNRPLPEPKIPDATKNPYVKIKKEKPDTYFLGSKKMLDKEAFSNLLVDWAVESVKIGRKNGTFKGFLKSVVAFGGDVVTEDIFYEEIIYFYMWLAYTNCVDVFQNKNTINGYFPYFTKKIYNLFSVFSEPEFGGYEEEEWEINLTKKLNGYVDAYNLSLKNKNFTPLGREFYKNLYGREGLGAITIYLFTNIVVEELKYSFESLGKGLVRYKI